MIEENEREKTEREASIDQERERDEIRRDPSLSPMIKRVMEGFWRAIDLAEGRPSSRTKH